MPKLEPILVAVLAIIGLSLAIVRAADPGADQKKIQGMWRYTKIVEDGVEMPLKGEDPDLGFDGDQTFWVIDGQRTNRATFRLDERSAPKSIDLTQLDGKEKGQTMRGIYQLSGDTLKLCLKSAESRPTEFKSTKEQIVFELKRKRATSVPASRPNPK